MPIVLTIRIFEFFAEELEANSVFIDTNIFRKIPMVGQRKSRFIVFRDKYRFSEIHDIKTNQLKFLQITDWTNGGRYYITKEGFPERVGTFILDGKSGKWKITLTPVVGKTSFYRLK